MLRFSLFVFNFSLYILVRSYFLDPTPRDSWLRSAPAPALVGPARAPTPLLSLTAASTASTGQTPGRADTRGQVGRAGGGAGR